MLQMAPTWWSILFLIFIISYTLTMMNMYFTYHHKSKNKASNHMNMKSMNWKW